MPSPFPALVSNLAAMDPDNLTTQRQADAAAIDSRRNRIVGSIEFLENLPLVNPRNPRPPIMHAQRHRLSRTANIHLHLAPCGSIFLSVRNEIQEDLRKRILVA